MDNFRHTLKSKHRDIYKILYKKRRSRIFRRWESISRRGSKYENPYALRQLKVSGFVGDAYRENIAVQEHVFVCLTSGSHIDEIFPYYVSKEYNVGLNQSSTAYIPGRFIFSYLTRKLEAFAEEPARARISPEFNVELHYLEIRKNYKPGRMTGRKFKQRRPNNFSFIVVAFSLQCNEMRVFSILYAK